MSRWFRAERLSILINHGCYIIGLSIFPRYNNRFLFRKGEIMKKEKQKNNKGFTLIELLVVVLIIGILASIALPQYQLVIDKTKFAKLRATVKTIEDACKRYYLLNDSYTSNMKDLDIDLPGEYTETTSYNGFKCRTYADFYCCINTPRKDESYGEAICAISDYSFAYRSTFFSSQGGPLSIQSCNAKFGNKRAEKLCSTFAKCSSGCENGNTSIPLAGSGYSTYRK